MLDTKSQLSRIVKAALDGEEVIIASHGRTQVKLILCTLAACLKEPGGISALSIQASHLNEAFGEAVDLQVAQLFNV